MPMTVARKKAVKNVENSKNLRITVGAGKDDKNPRSNLVQVLCIQYPIAYRKISILVLFDLNSEVNVIYLIFAKKLGLLIRPTSIRVQKINGIILNTYEMVVAVFSVTNKANQVRFTKEFFLVANVSL